MVMPALAVKLALAPRLLALTLYNPAHGALALYNHGHLVILRQKPLQAVALRQVNARGMWAIGPF